MVDNAYALTNEDFVATIDVVCPKCSVKAVVLGGQPFASIDEQESKVHFSCVSCGYTLKLTDTPKLYLYTNSKGEDISARGLRPNSPIDPYFSLELWFSVETKFGLLWAYNLAHLNVIESYIADKLRSRNGLPVKNNSIGSRLPQWVKMAKNRDYLLKIIAKAKTK